MGGPLPVATRVRHDAWNLSQPIAWHPTILWYARAVKALKGVTDPSDPRGWPYLARIHGATQPQNTWPQGVDDWNSCQHGSWFFLPWHRMYLHYFEQIVRDVIVQLGGPSDWALPFWDYSADPARSTTLALPPAFVATTWPDPGPNPLREEARAPGIRDGSPVDVEDVRLGTWTVSFSTDFLTRPSFGGPVTGWHHPPQGAGLLETQPHGTIHVDVGGPTGLMSAFATAPLDPIFWLHHCNIDRLWEVWRNLQNTELPTVTPWLDFQFPFGSGASRVEFAVSEVQDTTAAPLHYSYEGVPVPPAPAVPEGATPEASVEQQPPELLGATDPIDVGADQGRARIAIGRSTRPPGATPEAAESRRTFLTVENVTGPDLGAGVYSVWISAPDGDNLDPSTQREVGRFSTFGLIEASEEGGEHGGSGLTFSFDITDTVAELEGAGAWDPEALDVAITPARPVAEAVSEIRVGRVGVYRE
jgi:tyrosinase